MARSGVVFEPLVEGAVYFDGGSTFRRVVRLNSRTTATVQVLAKVSMPPTERDTPTHHYYRYKLAQPLHGMSNIQLARWTKRSGWGIATLCHPHDKKKTRFALGRLIPPEDYGKEYETYTYCD